MTASELIEQLKKVPADYVVGTKTVPVECHVHMLHGNDFTPPYDTPCGCYDETRLVAKAPPVLVVAKSFELGVL